MRPLDFLLLLDVDLLLFAVRFLEAAWDFDFLTTVVSPSQPLPESFTRGTDIRQQLGRNDYASA
jgi:hypothetical protein